MSTHLSSQHLKVKLALFFCLTVGSLISAEEISKHANVDTTILFSELTSIEGHALFHAYSGTTSKPGLLFIHGTPGSWQAFSGYLNNTQLQRDFFMVSIDRPGWGNSKLPTHKIDGNFSTQSAAIGTVFNRYPEKKWILVGHSLGASIAPQVALDYPESVSGLLLLAGSLKPTLGSPRWYNQIANTWVVAKLISKDMKHSNREIMGLRKQLSLMDEAIKQRFLAVNLIIMQGKKDRLVSPKNPSYAHQAWSDNFASILLDEIEGEGHFLPWRQSPRVIDAIYALLEKAGLP